MFGMLLKRAACVAALLALFVVPFGCTATPPRPGTLDDSRFYGGSYEQRRRVRDAVHLMEEPVQLAVRSIHVTNDCPNYKPPDEEGNPHEAGHCEPTRDICIRPAYARTPNVFHECGHALFMARSTDDRVRWTVVSIDAYGHTDGNFPRDGILTWYGATSPKEDFAEWVRWAMCYCHHIPVSALFVDVRVIDVFDPRYLAHLQLLREWGAISESQYEELEPLFTLRVNGAPLK